MGRIPFSMAIEAVKDGIHTIVATPHHQNGVYINEQAAVKAQTAILNERIKKEGLNLKILPGQEIRIYGEFLNDLKKRKLLTHNDKHKYILLEFPYDRVPVGVEQLIFNIQVAGYIPIITHPERNTYIRENPIIIYQLVRRGALTQITTSSLLGFFGKKVHKFTLEMIDTNLTHFLASDAHQASGNRGVNLKEGYEALEDYGGRSLVAQFKLNTEKVIQGKDIYTDVSLKIIRRKKILGLF